MFLIVYTNHHLTGSPNTVLHSNERIVGGEEVDIEDFPYQVSLTDEGRGFCGGSIYDNYHIITAGHCVYDRFTKSTV